ncbi:hypothetical protein [Shewanella livingstonensis]|uniref:Uncharacterized protein n=1 Tax=Shewanella livingstonensis TaxID=150120 RepID=A0A3G8LQ93_9GAMM|nr:hypothetical protein [Shewanella livingstonensis]AZG71415.1 hypothetical protein EGC82_00685 [Shewanella livingstonensis]
MITAGSTPSLYYSDWLVVGSVLVLSGCSSVLCQAQTDKEVDPIKQYDAQTSCERLVDEPMDDSHHDDANTLLLKQSIAHSIRQIDSASFGV